MRTKRKILSFIFAVAVALCGRAATVEAGFICTSSESDDGFLQVSSGMGLPEAEPEPALPGSIAEAIPSAALFVGDHATTGGMTSQTTPDSTSAGPAAVFAAAADDGGQCFVARLAVDRGAMLPTAFLSRLFRPPRS